MTLVAAALLLVLGGQALALMVLCARLSRGRRRHPAAQARPEGITDTSVSVVVPARNEAGRIGPCLDGLRREGAPLFEVIVVDGGSTDGMAELVDAAALEDPRIRRITEPEKAAAHVGRPWAITAGCAAAKGEWILVVDADVAPKPGMVAGAVAAAREHEFDVVSFAPRIIAPTPGARWLQPAFLTTLVYRFGPTGIDADPERVMGNGQCLLMRRSVLEREGGYEVAATSYCDDIRIVRHLAQRGARAGFLDGPGLLDVVMYETASETWRGWPRSLNMRDASSTRWRWLDGTFLLLAQALPLPLLLALAVFGREVEASPVLVAALVIVNVALVIVRLLLSVATAHSFARRGLAYWLSPLADPAAVLRIIETMAERPREWRGQGGAGRARWAATRASA